MPVYLSHLYTITVGTDIQTLTHIILPIYVNTRQVDISKVFIVVWTLMVYNIDMTNTEDWELYEREERRGEERER